MTIEIRQLIIRAEVRPDQGLAGAQPAKPTAPDWLLAARENLTDGPQACNQEDLVAACVRAVLRRLERSRER